MQAPHTPPSGSASKSSLSSVSHDNQPKLHICNLAAAIRKFVPVFVNDTDAPGGRKWDGKFEFAPGVTEVDAPTFPQFINTAAAAMFEITNFIALHEKLKQVLSDTQQAFAAIEAIVLPPSPDGKESDQIHPASTIAAITLLAKEHRQMNDVFENAAKQSPDKALKACQGWLMFRAKQDSTISFAPPPLNDSNIHSNS